MKKTLLMILVAFCLLLCGCQAKSDEPVLPVAQDFSAAGMTLTLTEDFAQKQHAAYTAYFESADLLVLGLKEEYTLFEHTDFSAQTSPERYADLVWKSNRMEGDVPLQESDDLLWFEYDNHVNGVDYRYRAYVFKANDGFWLVQFAAHAESFDSFSDTIAGYAASIYFDKPYISTLPEQN